MTLQSPPLMNITDNQNKLDWCKYGNVMEYVFIGLYGEDLGLIINPSKQISKDGKFAPDLYDVNRSRIADLKHVQEPFFKAQELYSLDPNFTVTLNRKDCERYYRKYPEIDIYFWVQWESQSRYGIQVAGMESVYRVPLKTLIQAGVRGELHEHHYKERTNDTAGNAKSSFVFDIRGYSECLIEKQTT